MFNMLVSRDVLGLFDARGTFLHVDRGVHPVTPYSPKQVFFTSLAVVLITIVAFGLVQAGGVELVDEIVEAGSTWGVVPAMTNVNFIIWMYRLALFGTFALVSLLLLSTKRTPVSFRRPGELAVVAVTLSVVWTIALVSVIAVMSLMPVEGFTVGPGSILVLDALYVAHVLHEPGAYIMLNGIVFSILGTIVNIGLRVGGDS